MKSKIRQKEIFKTLLFVLPYIAVEFTNTILVIIDKSLSNSIGKTAIIVFSSFVTLNWAINTIQACISQAHSIVLVRDREKHKVINTTGMFLELVTSSLIGILIFMFAKQITYIYTLEDDARTILTTILKLKAIQLPINSIAYIPKNKLKIDYKTKQIFIIMVIASTINIIGDLISIKYGYNEIGIYIATIISTIVNSILLLLVSKFKIGKISVNYIKEIFKYAKDLIFNKIIQRIVNIWYTSIASSFGTNIYAIHCVCATVIDTITEVIEGEYSGLLIAYSNDIESKKENIINKVDKISCYGVVCSIVISLVLMYPTWWLLGRAIPWNECNPYIWLYSLEFLATVVSCNYRAYLSANKDTKAIRNMALVGGICVRIPLALLVRHFNIGILGLSFVCGIDRSVRATYLRLYIRKNKENLA